eukprot:scaffold68994_cov28-Tisochrysis_lutea.AAC.6
MKRKKQEMVEILNGMTAKGWDVFRDGFQVKTKEPPGPLSTERDFIARAGGHDGQRGGSRRALHAPARTAASWRGFPPR